MKSKSKFRSSLLDGSENFKVFNSKYFKVFRKDRKIAKMIDDHTSVRLKHIMLVKVHLGKMKSDKEREEYIIQSTNSSFELFVNTANYCFTQGDFIREYTRITGNNLESLINRTPIQSLIDQSTGYEREVIATFLIHCYYLVYLPIHNANVFLERMLIRYLNGLTFVE